MPAGYRMGWLVRLRSRFTVLQHRGPGSFLRFLAALVGLAAGRAVVARLFLVPPPHRLLVERRELGRHLAGLVDVPPGVDPVEGPLDNLADEPAQPAGLGDPHGELVLALDE